MFYPFFLLNLQKILMEMRYLKLLFLLSLLVACHSKEDTDNTNEDIIKSPVVDNALSNQKVTAFAEDAQGHIWIGTFRGLNKYDVHNYHQYYCTDDSLDLPDNQINDIYRDSKGQLWIATVNGVCRYTDKDNFQHIAQDYPNKNCMQIVESKDGRIFINSMHQLAVYQSEKDQIHLAIAQFDYQHTYNLRCFIDPTNKLWAVNSISMRCYNSTTLALEDSIPLRGWQTAYNMTKDGRLWLGGNGTLTCFDTFSRKFIEQPSLSSLHPLLKDALITLIYPYNDNSLLINTNGSGLFLYNHKQKRIVRQGENGFPFEVPDFNISHLFFDSQKNLWIGSVDQGYRVCYNYKERFNTNSYLKQALKDKSVLSVAIDREHNLWIATLTDGLYVYNTINGGLKRIQLPQTTNKEGRKQILKVSRIFVDEENNIWLGASYAGKVLKCTYSNGILHTESIHDIFMPMSFAQDGQGTIWVGTSSYMLYAKRKGEKEFEPANVFQLSGTFIAGLLPIDNKVWVTAFMKPIITIDSRNWSKQELGVKDEDMKACIRRSVFIPTALFKDSRNDIWIGTISNGMLHYSTATGKLIPIKGAPCLDISSVEEDTQGNIWVSTMHGLGKYDRTVEKFTNYFVGCPVLCSNINSLV